MWQKVPFLQLIFNPYSRFVCIIIRIFNDSLPHKNVYQLTCYCHVRRFAYQLELRSVSGDFTPSRKNIFLLLDNLKLTIFFLHTNRYDPLDFGPKLSRLMVHVTLLQLYKCSISVTPSTENFMTVLYVVIGEYLMNKT